MWEVSIVLVSNLSMSLGTEPYLGFLSYLQVQCCTESEPKKMKLLKEFNAIWQKLLCFCKIGCHLN
jgi:hypothetical protein